MLGNFLDKIKDFLRQLVTEEMIAKVLEMLDKVKDIIGKAIEYIIMFRDWLFGVISKLFS